MHQNCFLDLKENACSLQPAVKNAAPGLQAASIILLKVSTLPLLPPEKASGSRPFKVGVNCLHEFSAF